MARFLAWFTALLLILFLAELTGPVQRLLVVPWTSLLAAGSAGLVALFDPSAIAHGRVLQNAVTGAGISIEAGCNGVEACIILAAAVLAYPASLRVRLQGLAAGVIAIQVLNVVRLISLFYLVQWNAAVFNFAHLYLWQTLIMLDVVAVWLVWLRWATRVEFERGGPAAAVPA